MGRRLTHGSVSCPEIESLHVALRRAYDGRDGSVAANARWHEAAVAFQSALQAFYAPYEEVLAGVRAGGRDAIEEATRFLVADPWCFRSGYLKAELRHALANTPLPSDVLQPLREVVLRRVVDRQPRLLRYATQLASKVWGRELEAQFARLETEGPPERRRAAAQVRAGASHRIRSLTDERGRLAGE